MCRIVGPVLGQRLGRLETGHARHADVEEQQVGTQRERALDRRFAVLHARHDGQLRPQARELGLQVGGEQRLVLGDQRGRGRRHVSAAGW